MDRRHRVEDIAQDVLNYRLDCMEPYLVRWCNMQNWARFSRDGYQLLILNGKIVPELSEYLVGREYLDMRDGSIVTYTHEIEIPDLGQPVVRFVRMDRQAYLALCESEAS